MKKIGIMNSEISKVISELGHTDKIVICDSGLPIPSHVKRIDLALKAGTPAFVETLETILVEMQVEKAYIAREINSANPTVLSDLNRLLDGVVMHEMSHEEFKQKTQEAKAIIRTGECSPYANVILEAGVIF